ncbi:MAG: peptidoglycan recognition protein family protein [Bacteroidia bacterium]
MKVASVKYKWLLKWTVFAIFLIAAVYYWNNRWAYIIIHHSAGSYGNIEFLQNVHDQRQSKEPIHAISYHYAIGNGNGMEDGKIGSDLRLKYNLWGAHMSLKNFSKNIFGLGICIIGDLENQNITQKQYATLVTLTMQLMHKYNIKKENVLFHGKVAAEQTKCPGKNFPYQKFMNQIEGD